MTESPTSKPRIVSFDLGPVVVKPDQTPDTSACEDTVAETPSPAAKEASVHGNLDQDLHVSLLSSSPYSPANFSHSDEEDDESTFLEQVQTATVEMEQNRQMILPESPKMENTLENAEAQTPPRGNRHPAVSPSPSSDESTISLVLSMDEGSFTPTSQFATTPRGVTPISQPDQGTPPSVRTSTLHTLTRLFPSPQATPTPSESEDGGSSEEEEELVPSILFSKPSQPPKIVNKSPTNLAPKTLFTEPPKNQDPAWKRPSSHSSPPAPALYDNASRYDDSLESYGQEQPVLRKGPGRTTMTGSFLPASLSVTPSPPSRALSNYRFDDDDALSTTESSICPFDCVEDYKRDTIPEPMACILKSTIPHPSELLQEEEDAVSEMGIEGPEDKKTVSKKPAHRLSKILSKVMGKGVSPIPLPLPSPPSQELEQELDSAAVSQDSTELPIELDAYSSIPIEDRRRLAKQHDDDDEKQKSLVASVRYSISESFSLIGHSLWTIASECMPSRSTRHFNGSIPPATPTAGIEEIAAEDKPAPPPLQPRLSIDSGSLDLAYDESQEVLLKEMTRAEEEDFEKQQPEPAPQLTKSMMTDDEDEVVEKEPKSKASSSTRKWIWFIILIALLLIIIIVASVLGANKSSNNSSNASKNSVAGSDNNEPVSPGELVQDLSGADGDQVAIPSPAPVVQVPGLFPVPGSEPAPGLDPIVPSVGEPQEIGNSQCMNATTVLGDSSSVSGSTVDAGWDGRIFNCDIAASPGPGLWYVLEATESKSMRASTCGGADFDTQITILSGSCDGLTCVAFNDQGCGDQSQVTWFAESGTTYFVMVHGYRGAQGSFSLAVEPAPENNDFCDGSVGPVEIGSSVASTTTNATVDDVEACGNVDVSTPGVWFRVDTMNHNELLQADVLSTGSSAFIGQISVFSGGSCQSLVCEAGNSTGNLSWNAQQDTTYYLLVNGRDDLPADFELSIGFDPALVPMNSVCPAAMDLMPDDPVFLGSTNHAPLPNVTSCGNSAIHTAPGVWFRVRGSGNVLSASACNPETNFDTTLTLYRGDCNSLECVDTNFQDRTSCGEQSSITWLATDKEDYFVLVSGYGSSSGDFGLSIQEIQLDVGFDCTSAPLVAPSANSTTFGSTDLATGVFVGCGDGTSAGVWHRVEGTGVDITASTCHPGTTFDARISVLTGSCGSLVCADAVDTHCGEQMFTTWPTVVGEVYYLLVHGSVIGSAGEFVLTVEEGTTPTVEDSSSINGGSCASANGPLLNDGSTVLDSTTISAFGNAGTCVGNTDPSRGTWYEVLGLGSRLTVDTCSEHTDFDTEIHVFTGDCDNLLCVASNDDSDACGQQSSVSWDALRETSYLILVRGAGANEFGNFELQVSLASGSFFGS